MITKKRLFIVIGCIMLVLGAAIVFCNYNSPQDEMMAMLDQMENALGEEWEKQTVTKVSDLVYSDSKGNNIVYHVCTTTYYEADATKQSGLNTEAISAVISPDEAESCRECTVSGLPAAIYQKDGLAYLCWTIRPEISCVIEYDPNVQNEYDMLRMAESVPANDVSTTNP